MTPHEVGKILRVIYGDQKDDCREEMLALSTYAADPNPDDEAVLERFGLAELVRAVLIDGTELPDAGQDASFGRYATEIQARAYAVAHMHMAGRVLVWNRQAYQPLRSHIGRLQRELDTANIALRAKIAFPANSNVPIKVKRAADW